MKPLVACVAVFIAIASSGCRRMPGAGTAYPVMPAGARGLVTDHFASEAHTERTLSRAATGDTTERQSVVARIDEIVATAGKTQTIVTVTTGHYSGGDYYDSLFVDRAGLRPLREHFAYVQSGIDKRFAYNGGAVHQTNTSRDSSYTFDRHYDLPVFAFGEIEMLVRSLPYHRGYSAILPLYSEGDDAIEMDSVAVTDAGPNRWTIRFADPVVIAVYGIEASTRRIVSYKVTNRKTLGSARKVYEALPGRLRGD